MEFRLEHSRVVFDVHPKVSAWFSTRRGGVSFPPFDSMNLAYGGRDFESSVTENRRRMLGVAGRSLDDLVMPLQVHKNRIEWITATERGRGARGHGHIPDTDGLLAETPDVVLGMGFADCVPIFLTDIEARFVGLLHAGWRGTAAEIPVKAVRRLGDRGIAADELLVGIGPSIGPCCYEIDQPVRAQVGRAVGEEPLAAKDPEHWWLDLKKANRILLERAGVRKDRIAEAPFCTGCRRDLFFSYRLEHHSTGRMGGFICLN